MGRITSSIGLISGLPIVDTVDQLISVQARPRDLLIGLNQEQIQKQSAFTEISTLLVGFQLSINALRGNSLFEQRVVTSSNEAALSAVATTTPSVGSFQFTPLQNAKSHQLLSTGFASDEAPLGAGTFSFGFGGFVDADRSLDGLNSGLGVEGGQIRIVDRSGASTVVDLRFSQTVDEVLKAINQDNSIDVRAETIGDSIRLIDTSGQSLGDLRVEEVGLTNTAADLGILGTSSTGTLVGQDVLRLFDGLALDQLNDRLGVRTNAALPEFEVRFRDGSDALQIDLQRQAVAGTSAQGTTAAAGGSHAQVVFTAVQPGSDFDGVTVEFENDDNVTVGNETVAYDENAKVLTFKIDEGNTTANHIISALTDDEAAGALFEAARPDFANGTGLIDVTDTAVLGDPPAEATTLGGANAALEFTAVQGGAEFAGVQIIFEENASISPGEESFVYDDTDPDNKTLTVQITSGQTKASDVVALLKNDPGFSAVFSVRNAIGSNGSGIVTSSDGVTTSGGVIVEPVEGTNEFTLGDVLATINAADPTRLQAAYSANGDRIVLTDLTTDNGGTFEVVALNGEQTARDLGLVEAAVGGVINGRRLIGGLKSTLVSTLDGGKGLELGALDLRDRSGAFDTVDLSTAETVEEVVAAINAASVQITAQINPARNGIELLDTSGSTAGNLIVANGDATTFTADRLGVTVDDAVNSVTGSSLDVQTVSENTRLDTYNGGAGVARGTLTISDTLGNSELLDLTSEDIGTVGDVLQEIRRLGLAVDARINDDGDGIVLVDTGYGGAELKVESGIGTTARDLHLLGDVLSVGPTAPATATTLGTLDPNAQINFTAVAPGSEFADVAIVFENDDAVTVGNETVVYDDSDPQNKQLVFKIDDGFTTAQDVIAALNNDATARAIFGAALSEGSDGTGLVSTADSVTTVAGPPASVIDGASHFDITLDADDTLTDLVTRINDLGAGVSASSFNDGSAINPFRFTLLSNSTGQASELLVDTAGVTFDLHETVAAQDARLLFGSPNSALVGAVATSTTDAFEGLVPGLSLTIGDANGELVTINIDPSEENLVSSVQNFVDDYNSIRTLIDQLTEFDEESGRGSILLGDTTLLRVETDLANLISGRFPGVGSIQSLREIGVELDQEGELSLNVQRLKEQFANNPSSVEALLTAEDVGVIDRFDQLVDQLAAGENALLINRLESLTITIADNTERIDFLDDRLERSRAELLDQFIRMERAIGDMQVTLNALSSIAALPAYRRSGDN